MHNRDKVPITKENPKGWTGDTMTEQHNNWLYQGILWITVTHKVHCIYKEGNKVAYYMANLALD